MSALAIHPTQNQFVTAGYDKSVHLWDSMAHLVVWTKDLGESAQAAAFSPDGSVLIISTTTQGRWIVFDATTRQLLSIHSDGSDLLETIKFSPDGRYIAFGSRDNNVYIYQVSEEYRKFNRIGRCSGHSSYVVHIGKSQIGRDPTRYPKLTSSFLPATKPDWDTSNTYIQTVSLTNEHLFWNATICRQLNNMAIARDLEFATHNCVLGFSAFGIWPEAYDGADILSADRSATGKLLVAGDDLGRLNLFSYPACQPKCLHHAYTGHSVGVAAVRFLSDDSRIISIGGRDSSIMQWSVS